MMTVGTPRVSSILKASAAICVIAASLAASASAQAATCTASTDGGLSLYQKSSCKLPVDSTEQKVFFNAATGVNNFTGTVGGATANFSSTSSVNVANGFATVKPAVTGGRISDLTISLPNYTFSDIKFDAKFFGGANKISAPFTVTGFNSSGVSLGSISYALGALTTNANISFMLMSDMADIATVVLSSAFSNGAGGFRSIRHIELSGVTPSEVPLPQSALLLVSGLIGLAALGRRRRANSTPA